MATHLFADTDPTTVVASDDALIWVLLIVFIVALAGAYGLTLYNITAPRTMLQRVLKAGMVLTEQQQSDLLRRAALVSERVTRASLAFIGFALLGILVIAALSLTGAGAQDLRSTIAGSVTTLIASIAGFYFATRSESLSKSTSATSEGDPPTAHSDDDPGDRIKTPLPAGTSGAGSAAPASSGGGTVRTTLDASS